MAKNVDDLLGISSSSEGFDSLAPVEAVKKGMATAELSPIKTKRRVIDAKDPITKDPYYKFMCRVRYWVKRPEGSKDRGTTVIVDIPFFTPSLDVFNDSYKRTTAYDDDGKPVHKEVVFKNFLGKLRKEFLPKLMASKFEDFHRIHQLIILSIESRNGAEEEDLPVQYYGYDKLSAYIKMMSIPIKPEEYPTIQDLRGAVLAYKENPEMFFKSREEVMGRLKIEKSIRDMNAY